MFIRVVTIRNNVVDKHKIVTQKNVYINNSVVFKEYSISTLELKVVF